jgi:PAS domain S-box-containing protein
MYKVDATKKSANLRKQAEKQLQEQSAVQIDMSPEQAPRFLHELQVHQIELEMQNDELRLAQTELEALHAKYFDLYNFAPIGYFTLHKEGLIKEVNLAAAQLLGLERRFVVEQPITRFIYRDDQDIYYLHIKKLFDTGLSQECELRLVKKDGSPFWGYLRTTATQEDESGSVVCQTALIDITEHKQADEELAKYHNHLKELVKELEERNNQLQEEIMQRKQAEEQVLQQIKELKERNNELARMNNAMVGRELRMVELKKEVNELCTQAGESPRYPGRINMI